jgi:hypothetical protein
LEQVGGLNIHISLASNVLIEIGSYQQEAFHTDGNECD